MPDMVVTRDTSHFDMSPLNDFALVNTLLMSVMLDTSHSAIDPCGPVGQSPIGDNLTHASTALVSSVLDDIAVVIVHTDRDIDPDEPVNIFFLLALELTQLIPQSSWLNDAA